MRRFLQQHGRNERPQVWEISQTRNAVHTMWGQQGGAMQQTVQTFEGVNVGKTNEKTPTQVAQEFLERTIKKKNREGYVEVDLRTNKPLVAESASEIDFSKPLPLNLRFFKPQNSMSAGMSKRVAAGAALALRKRNGYAHPVVLDQHGQPTMYGSNMLPGHKDEPGIPWLDRYPKIRADLLQIAADVPARTIFLGELVTVSSSGYADQYGADVDDFIYVGSIVKSKKDLALEKQDNEGHLGYCLWDVAFWDGECWLQTKTPEERFDKILELVGTPGEWVYPHLRMTEMWPTTGEFMDEAALLAFAKEHKWEGWVIVDPNGNYGDRAFNFHGKAERPAAVCKLKPTLEVDVIARWDPKNGIGEFGKGKKSGGVGSAATFMWDPDKGEEVYLCDVGGGLTDEQVKEFANPKRYPQVWVVEFANWTPKGAMFHPVFLRERDDKTCEECTIDQRPPLEEAGE